MANSNTNSGNNGFRSILSSFQKVVGTASNHNSLNIRENHLSTMKERAESLMRTAQIRRATSSSVRNKNVGNTYDIHIAICACIIDDFPHENIWRAWIDTDMINRDSSESYSNSGIEMKGNISAEIYIHAKSPEKIKSPFVRSKIIGITFRPEWNDVKLVCAMLSLAKEALKNGSTTHILFVTESCIPISTIFEVAYFLRNFKGRSFINAYNNYSDRCSRFDEHQCWNILSLNFPGDAIYKALPGWCMVCKQHMEKILDLPKAMGNDRDIWPAFKDVWAPEELYFATALALVGVLPGDEIVLRSLIFAKWDSSAKIHSERSHPINYDKTFTEKIVSNIRKNGYYFMRKLKRPISVHLWKSIVLKSFNDIFDKSSSMFFPKKKYIKYRNIHQIENNIKQSCDMRGNKRCKYTTHIYND